MSGPGSKGAEDKEALDRGGHPQVPVEGRSGPCVEKCQGLGRALMEWAVTMGTGTCAPARRIQDFRSPGRGVEDKDRSKQWLFLRPWQLKEGAPWRQGHREEWAGGRMTPRLSRVPTGGAVVLSSGRREEEAQGCTLLQRWKPGLPPWKGTPFTPSFGRLVRK